MSREGSTARLRPLYYNLMEGYAVQSASDDSALASHQHSRARQLWVMAQAMIVPLTPLKRETALPENDCFWARRLVRGGVPLPN